MSKRVYVGDVGTEILIDVGVSLAEATTTEIVVRKPDGTPATWEAVVSGTSLKYIVKEGDLNQSGDYQLQPHVALPGWAGRGVPVVMTVHKAL